MADDHSLARLDDGRGSVPARYQARAREYLDAALSDNTRAAYASALRSFWAWCEREDLSPLPAGAGTIIGYVTWLAEVGRPWSTINQHLAAVGKAHEGRKCPCGGARVSRPDGASIKACDLCDEQGNFLSPRDHAVVRRVCKGIRRKIGTAPRTRKKALLRADVEKVVATLPAGSPIADRDRAAILLGFACALRREELSELNAADLELTEKGLVVKIKSSKTDKEGKGELLGIPREAARTIEAVQAWLNRKLSPHALFCDFSLKGVPLPETRLSPQGVGKLVLRALERAELIPRIPRRKPAGAPRRVRSHGAHSLRAGFITQARLDGKQLDEIMGQSRHKSYEVARDYVRHVDIFESNAAKGVAL